MKGFANMQDYKTAFREKGVIGSVLEFGGSTYIVYRAVDELADKLKDEFDNNGSSRNRGTRAVRPGRDRRIPGFLWTDGRYLVLLEQRRHDHELL
jgi:hypothetical protein